MMFFARVRQEHPRFFHRVAVLDIGSLDINGNNRYLFDDALYIGIDVGTGKNVDFVVKGHEFDLPDDSFDVVISSECLEHDQHYAQTLTNAVRLLRPGGMLTFTCATTGRAEHGTRRTTPEAAPLLADHGAWGDYYRNLTAKDVCDVIDVQEVFSSFSFQVNEVSCDLYFWGVKKGSSELNRNGSFHSVADSIAAHRTTIAALEARNRDLEAALEDERVTVEQLRRRSSAIASELISARRALEQKSNQVLRLQSTWHQKTAVTIYRAAKKVRGGIKGG
ncbi:MAG: methyltransferase domain-containing protein [Kofleriaceae bacterium]|nr:methyltransferase domain-containing protein [Kofleriaceae bacterium]